jgi:hypothetical protein
MKLPELPAGTRFWDVDGTPVAALPGEPPKRYDREPAVWYDPSDVDANGVVTTKADFLALVETASALRRRSSDK